MKKQIKNYLSILVTVFLVTSCSSGAGAPTTPNKAQIMNSQKTQTTPTEIEIKKVNLNGRIIDASTKKPIENANILVYAITNDNIVKSIKDGAKVIELKDGKDPKATTPATSTETPAPSAIPTEAPPNKPMPFIEENEEKSVKKPVAPLNTKSSTTNIKVDIKQPVNKANENKKFVPKETTAPLPDVKADEKTKDEKDDTTQIDLVSALSSLKMNDIQEFETKTGNDGKFWINKVPENNLIITVTAPNYKTVSIFNADISKVEDIALQPLENKENNGYVLGSVLSANDNPIDNAVVTSSYIAGDSFYVPNNSDSEGKFELDNLTIGERTLVAHIKNEDGKIIALGMLDFDIKKDSYKNKKEEPKKLEPKKVDEKTTSEKDANTVKEIFEKKDEKKPQENEEEVKKDTSKKDEVVEVKKDEKKKDKDKPEIKVKAVTEYVTLKGKITANDNNTLKNINVYVEFKKKGQPKEEFFLTDKKLEAKADSFELSLPKLEAGFYYHLEFVASDKKGSYLYHHEYKVKKEDKEMKIAFMAPITAGKSDFIEKDTSKIPVFSWTPVAEAAFYKVSLDKVDKNNNITTIWEGITPFNTAVYPVTTGSGKLTKENTYFWSVVAIKENADQKTALEKILPSKINLITWSDLSKSLNFDFESPLIKNDEEIEEIDTKKKDG